MIVPQISINYASNDDNQQIYTEINKTSIRKINDQPPIITHTSPTPSQTPSNSCGNSPLLHAKFVRHPKLVNEKLPRRTLSLDSASDRVKVKTDF